MVPKSTYNISKEFSNIHLVWIDWCIHRHAVTTTHDDQDLRMQLKSWVAFGRQIIPLSCNWDCRPTLHGSHIHFKHYHGEWQHSYDVDEQTNPSPCCYHCSCWYKSTWTGSHNVQGLHLHRRIVGYQILQRIFWKTKKLFPSLNFHTRFLHTLIDTHSTRMGGIKNIYISNLPVDLWKIQYLFFPHWTFICVFAKWSVTFMPRKQPPSSNRKQQTPSTKNNNKTPTPPPTLPSKVNHDYCSLEY